MRENLVNNEKTCGQNVHQMLALSETFTPQCALVIEEQKPSMRTKGCIYPYDVPQEGFLHDELLPEL